ncbi:hypothetical protein GCM10011367_17490 [Marinicauda pacifica]|nr:hypothetical protein GCM10011367_17490 [Marinicauda pacifica]
MQALRLLERYALNRADVIVTLSSGMAEAIRELGVRTPVIVAPPQLDVHKFKVLPEPANPTVVYSGAMGRKQGLHQILAAAEVLKTRDSEIQIVIRGQGGIKDELVTLAHSKNLTNVRFEPLAPFDQLNEAMASGHIHLVPQASDGADFAVPSKIFSIMACGRPFIATAHAESPLADLAEQSGSGVVVTPDDPFALADAITSLMKSESTRLNYGANGRRYVERCVDRSVVCEKIWDALINKSVAVNRIGTEAV